MQESLLDRCVMVFVLCLGILLLFLQLVSTPSGQAIPASLVALSLSGAMCVIAIATLRSRVAGWNKRVVKIVGVLFALMAVWLICDPPADLRTALLDIALGTGWISVPLIAIGTAYAWRTFDWRDPRFRLVFLGLLLVEPKQEAEAEPPALDEAGDFDLDLAAEPARPAE